MHYCRLLERLQANPEALTVTEERIAWPGLMHQYWAPAGMRSVLADFLERSAADAVQFGTKVTKITAAPAAAGGISVSALRRAAPAPAPATGTGGGAEPVSAKFDSVVVTVPAPDCLAIGGIKPLLSPGVAEVLGKVGYDSRWSVAAVYSSAAVCGAVRAWLGRATERTLDGDWDPQRSGWHLLARAARGPAAAVAAGGGKPCAVVGHTSTARPPGYADRAAALAGLHQIIAERTGVAPGLVADAAVASKAVDWQVAQMIRPVDAVMEPRPPAACFAAGGLVVTGDYMTQASFVGCYAAADAAVEAVLRQLPGQQLPSTTLELTHLCPARGSNATKYT